MKQAPNIQFNQYHPRIVVLHWAMAVLIVLMLISGFIIKYVQLDIIHEYQLIQLHKSVGVMTFVLLVIRIGIRVTSQVPAMPPQLTTLEKKAAKLGHLGLYLIVFTSTVSGWIAISSSDLNIPTYLLGLIQWPNLPLLGNNEVIHLIAKKTHFISAWALTLCLLGHIGAVIKHYFYDQENLLHRITWEKIPTAMLLPMSLFIALVTIIALPLSNKISNNISNSNKAVVTDGLSLYTAPESEQNAADPHHFLVDYTNSNITFFGHYNKQPFQGTFGAWHANIHFNSDNLSKSHIKVHIKTDSAHTGVQMYDATLPETAWFNVEAFPESIFESQHISKSEDHIYQVEGLLSLRGITLPMQFDFKLSDLSINPVQVSAEFTIDRQAFGIGASVDPNNDWVSKDITIRIMLLANKREEA